MISTLRNAWKIPELKKRILFTFFMLILYRMGNFILVPGIHQEQLKALTQTGGLFSVYDLLSGGAFSNFSIFAMGVVPYINSSIIFQLLTIAIPALEQLSKEGEDGRKKIQEYTRYGAIVFGVVQGLSTYAIISRAGALEDGSKFNMFLIILTLTTASTFLMWFGDKITERGIGNGTSLIIFVNIISRFPTTIYQVAALQKAEEVNFIQVIMLLAAVIILFLATVVVSLAERRIPVQYAGKTINGRVYRGQSTHIPINIASSAVIAIIFAMSVMAFPATLGQFWPESKAFMFITTNRFSPFKEGSWLYILLFSLLILFFTWFYTEVTMKPEEMAENMNKSSGFIPGIRPGEPTANYISKVLNRTSFMGGIFAAIIAIVPIIVAAKSPFTGIHFGGTSLMIMVSASLESLRQIESQLVMRHYQGFLK